jgi:hypothetical protein
MVEKKKIQHTTKITWVRLCGRVIWDYFQWICPSLTLGNCVTMPLTWLFVFICKFNRSDTAFMTSNFQRALPLSNSSLNRTVEPSFIHKIIPSPSFFLFSLLFFHSPNLHPQILYIFFQSLKNKNKQKHPSTIYNFSLTRSNLSKVIYLSLFNVFNLIIVFLGSGSSKMSILLYSIK